MVAEKNNATCSICGRSYYKCLSCRDSMKMQPWKVFTDTSEHYKVFQAVRGLSTGVYSKDEFKSKLKNIDLSDLETYKEHIKVLIKEALKEDVVEVEPIKKNKVVEEISKDVVTEENAVAKEVEVTIPRKRNYKVNNKVEETE